MNSSMMERTLVSWDTCHTSCLLSIKGKGNMMMMIHLMIFDGDDDVVDYW